MVLEPPHQPFPGNVTKHVLVPCVFIWTFSPMLFWSLFWSVELLPPWGLTCRALGCWLSFPHKPRDVTALLLSSSPSTWGV